MATASGASPVHITTSGASGVDTVTINGVWPYIQVVNVDGTDAVYFSVNGVDPTVAGAGVHVVAKLAGAYRAVQAVGIDMSSSTITVKLINSGSATKVAIYGLKTLNDDVN